MNPRPDPELEATYFYLGNTNEAAFNPHHNGSIHIESKIMHNGMASVSKAERLEPSSTPTAGNEVAHMRQILKELDSYLQPAGPTRITTDNSTAGSFASKRTKIKRSKQWT